MKRILTAASCAIALCLACDSGGDPSGQTTAAAEGAKAGDSPTGTPVAPPKDGAKAEPAGKPSAQADPPAAATGPATSGAFRMPGEPGYDCGRLLNRAQIQETCGTELKQVIIDGNEGKRDQTRCSRRWRSLDDKRTISMSVGKYDKPLTKPESATDIPGVGELAYAWSEERAPEIMWHTARSRQGQWVIDIRSIVTDGGEAQCDLEQLGKLNAGALAQMKQSG